MLMDRQIYRQTGNDRTGYDPSSDRPIKNSSISEGDMERTQLHYMYIKQEAHGPQLAHLSKIVTAYLQMPCNIATATRTEI